MYVCVCVCVCVCVFVASVTKHAMRLRYIVNYGLTRSTIFSYIIHKRQDFRKKSYST